MNCNTTHYRANSSSVPGDPTKIIKAEDKHSPSFFGWEPHPAAPALPAPVYYDLPGSLLLHDDPTIAMAHAPPGILPRSCPIYLRVRSFRI